MGPKAVGLVYALRNPQFLTCYPTGRIATFFLSTLIGSTILSGLIAAVPIIMHFYYLKPHRNPHREYVTDNVSAWLFWLAANILISWYLAMIINIIPAIVTWFVDLR